MVKEHERVVLQKNMSDHGLVAGDVGTVIHVHKGGKAFEVEFFALDGRTIAIDTLRRADVRPGGAREMLHARPLAGAA